MKYMSALTIVSSADVRNLRSSLWWSGLVGPENTVESNSRKNRIPAEAAALLDELSTKLPSLLAGNLLGIYLYGSITNSSFNPRRSDIDCIVVTRRDPGETQFRKVDRWLKQTEAANSWTKRLQITFLVKDELLRVNS